MNQDAPASGPGDRGRGDDITEDFRLRRLGGRSGTSAADPPSSVASRPLPDSAPEARFPVRRISRAQVWTTAGLLLAGAAVSWYVLRPRPVELTVGGAPLGNAAALLQQAEALLQETAAADGASLAAGAGCWFAPAEREPASVGRWRDDSGPRVACGPVSLGIAQAGEQWLVGEPAYGLVFDASRPVNGSLRRFEGVATVSADSLVRPDGRKPPSQAPPRSLDGLRTAEGRRLLDVDSSLRSADESFRRAAVDSGASVVAESRCYFGVVGEQPRVTDEQVWCGPILLRSSDPGETWLSVGLSLSEEGLVAARPREVRIGSFLSTEALTPGVQLWRPDGLAPPPGDGGVQPPDAEPQDPDFTDLREDLPGELTLTAVAGRRLTLPSVTVIVAGVARVPKIGAGETALVAAADHDLVVARLLLRRAPSAGLSDMGDASLLVDGRRVRLSGWTFLDDQGHLVASVPRTAAAVELEVTAEDTRRTVSLLAGAARGN